MVCGGGAVWGLTVYGWIAVWDDDAKTIIVGLAPDLREGRRATVYESRWEVGVDGSVGEYFSQKQCRMCLIHDTFIVHKTTVKYKSFRRDDGICHLI